MNRINSPRCGQHSTTAAYGQIATLLVSGQDLALTLKARLTTRSLNHHYNHFINYNCQVFR